MIDSLPLISPATCGVCEVEKATIDCPACRISICERCNIRLHRGGIKHEQYPLGQGGVKPKECSTHPGKPITCCTGDGNILCDSCKTEVKIKTRHYDLYSMYRETIDGLHQSLSQIQHMLFGIQQELDTCVQLKEQISTNSERLQKEIREKFNQMTEMMKQKCEILCNDISMRELKKLKRVSVEEDLLRETSSSAKILIDNGKGLLNQRCASTVLFKGRAIRKLKESNLFTEQNSGYLDIRKATSQFPLSLSMTEKLLVVINENLTFDEEMTTSQRDRFNFLINPIHCTPPSQGTSSSKIITTIKKQQTNSLIREIINNYS